MTQAAIQSNATTGNITTTLLDCGAVLVVEPIGAMQSLAIRWLMPGGSARDPDNGIGHSTLLAEMMLRGAGQHSSRELSEAFDRLGVDRSCRSLSQHHQLAFTMLGSKLDEALPLMMDVLRQPRLPDDALDAVRNLCLQSLAGLPDDPQHLVMLKLREAFYQPPFDRHSYGEQSILQQATIDDLRRSWQAACVPDGMIITAAGDVDPAHLAAALNRHLSDFTGNAAELPKVQTRPGEVVHVKQDTAQVHIGVAYDAPRERDAHSMLERLGVAVLSGSSSGRLFTEVRQKRSLCYSVGASYRAGRESGLVSMYAGTTPERAQETLDVAVQEMRRMHEGVSEEEFNRAVIGLKSRLIMQGESSGARASAIANDQHKLGRARTLDEIAAAIDSITRDDLNAYLAGRDIGKLTIASIGPEPLNAPA